MLCEEFLQGYSTYLDGLVSDESRAAFETHVEACATCRQYDRVVRSGLELCKDLPDIHSSPDFIPRLKHRLYHVDDATRLGQRHVGSAALVAVASVGFLALAWLPFATRMSVEVELPPVAVTTPVTQTSPEAEVPALFRSGPFVESSSTGWHSRTLGEDGSFFDLLYSPRSGEGLRATRVDVAADATR